MGRPWKHTLETLKPGEYFSILDGPHRVNNVSYPVWRCLCCCGKEFFEQGCRINSGRRQSCGCTSRLNRWQLKYNEPQTTAYKKIISRYKSASKQNNRNWLLSEEEAIVLLKSKCHYCKNEPYRDYNCYVSKTGKYRIGDKDWCSKAMIKFNGIDRLNSSLGYLKSNVVSCCYICNRAKGDMSYDDFMNWISSLVENRIEK